jgi:hypothetical protein
MATTTATSPRTTTATRAFPLKYFVIAFAFTWLFWRWRRSAPGT